MVFWFNSSWWFCTLFYYIDYRYNFWIYTFGYNDFTYIFTRNIIFYYYTTFSKYNLYPSYYIFSSTNL